MVQRVHIPLFKKKKKCNNFLSLVPVSVLALHHCSVVLHFRISSIPNLEINKVRAGAQRNTNLKFQLSEKRSIVTLGEKLSF